MKKPMGIYIHIPFCSKKCDYCDFVSYSTNEKAQHLYLEGLFNEIDYLKHKFKDKVFNTLYIGGGTPSIVYSGFISALSKKVFNSFNFDKDTEFTIEVNPNSFTEKKFLEYKNAGVNRISVGVQSINSKLLKKVGRHQDYKNIKNTFKLLKDSKFNTSGDCMIGLPNQSKSSVKKTIKFLIKNDVKHISTYSLQLEKHTPLYDMVRQGIIKPMSDEKTLKLYDVVYKTVKKYGYNRYEISNFARHGFESRHNQKYWNNTMYLGLGVASHSYIDGVRYYNTKRLDLYLDKTLKSKSPILKKEFLSKEEKRTERIMLALRTSKGLNLKDFKKEFDEDLLVSKDKEIKKLLNLDMLKIENDWLKITEKNFNVSNSIIVELI